MAFQAPVSWKSSHTTFLCLSGTATVALIGSFQPQGLCTYCSLYCSLPFHLPIAVLYHLGLCLMSFRDLTVLAKTPPVS